MNEWMDGWMLRKFIFQDASQNFEGFYPVITSLGYLLGIAKKNMKKKRNWSRLLRHLGKACGLGLCPNL
jgi:hypothetical protein